MPRYPDGGTARDRFVISQRPLGPRATDPWAPQGLDVEDEAQRDGGLARVATVFLTGRECPWRCAMCDLWRFTTSSDTPAGAIPAQLARARNELGTRGEAVSHYKLYNASNFFDPHAVPFGDYDAIAHALSGATRVIVESHPSLVGAPVERLLNALQSASGGSGAASLEVAMGLETSHPEALEKLNKRMTLDTFRTAARFLAEHGVAVRAFLLIHPPFVRAAEQDLWLLRSIDEAIAAGSSAVSLIPTRPGNGALDSLAAEGHFTSPRLEDAERALAVGLDRAKGRSRVFLDLWDLERLASCAECFEARRERLRRMNQLQAVLPDVLCSNCMGLPA